MTDNAKSSKPGPAEAAGAQAKPQSRAPAGHSTGVDPIAVGLQKLFAAVAEEPVPDDFMALLDRIEAAERDRADERDANKPPSTGGRASR